MSCCLFGAIISATDPVAVVALLKELGVDTKISTLIEGESLLNDGTAYVIFVILLKVVSGGPEAEAVTIYTVLYDFVKLSCLGPVIGWIFA